MLLLLLLVVADDSYAQGMRYFEQAMFEQAVEPLKHALAGKLSGAETKKARLALAQSCFYVHDLACAKAQVLKLSKAKATIDPKLLPPDFVAFYESIAPSEPLPPPLPAPQVNVPPPPPTPPQPPAPAQKTAKKKTPERHAVTTPTKKETPDAPEATAKPFEEEKPPATQPQAITADVPPPSAPLTPWYLRMLPLGIGHFLQGDPLFGTIFVTLEVGALAANIALAVVNERRVQPDGRLPGGAASAQLYWAQQGTAIAAYAIFAIGLIDGLFLSPLRHKSNVTVGPGPGLGAAASVRF